MVSPKEPHPSPAALLLGFTRMPFFPFLGCGTDFSPANVFVKQITRRRVYLVPSQPLSEGSGSMCQARDGCDRAMPGPTSWNRRCFGSCFITRWFLSFCFHQLQWRKDGQKVEGLSPEHSHEERGVRQQEKGLSLLVHHVLGKPLDKTEQLSNWEKRPLREEQILYAGLALVWELQVPRAGWVWLLCPRESR